MFTKMPNIEEGLDLMKKFWASIPSAANVGAGMPGAAGLMPGLQVMMPTMDLDELDKHITDMKAVESWLTLNMKMLHSTIQALEMQRATLAAVQSFGAAAGQMGQQTAAAAAAKPAPAAEPADDPVSPISPFAAAFAAGPFAVKTECKPEPDVEPEAEPEPPAAKAKAKPKTGTKAAGKSSAKMPDFSQYVSPNPAAAWWDLLQGQFEQISRAAQSAGAKPAAKNAAKGAVKSAAKSTAKKGAARKAAKKGPAAKVAKPAADQPP
ncbi:MAG: hypothetical protein MO853_06400 [Candidatus Protistobacter heckmanni]|nr:hypothetical protein [Candidatus Protistobacter heckmanni]